VRRRIQGAIAVVARLQPDRYKNVMYRNNPLRQGDFRDFSGDLTYWENHYGRFRTMWPSQFAAFVLGEIPIGALIDIGCGNGRDTLFFASHGMATVGVDWSKGAITICERAREQTGISSASFVCASVTDASLRNTVVQRIPGDVPRTVYARFFLHAVDGAIEDAFFSLAGAICRAGDRLAVEYRTTRDANQPKAMPDHYRRFVEPMTIVEKAHDSGFSSLYFVEGFGLAKFREDDAHVARNLFVKR
jgi:SAM-dependent methyltransferase